MLATVVATSATLSSNSCKNASFLNALYFRATETVLHKQYISLGSEQLQASAHIKKLKTDVDFAENVSHLGGDA